MLCFIKTKHGAQNEAAPNPLHPLSPAPRGMSGLLAADAFTLTYSGAQTGKDPHPSLM